MHRALLTGLATAALLVAAGPAPSATAADAAPRQWYLDAMGADEIWKVSTGEGVKVAVIGTGVNPETPSLRGQVLPGKDALVADGLAKGDVTDTRDTTGAGTTAAELIAGTGRGGGLKGLAPGVKIVPIRVPPLRHDELPDLNYPLSTAIKAAVDSGARVIDITVGNQYVIGSDFDDQALEYAIKKGVLMFAGVGDNAKEGNKPQYPAAYDEVVGVAAIDRTGTVAPTSQHGDAVDISAPGVDIPRWCDAGFRRYCADGDGTAAAAALVSAQAALVWSKHRDWTAAQVWRVLADTAGRKWPADELSRYLGYGIARARQVVVLGRGRPGPPDRNTKPAYVQPLPGSPGNAPSRKPSQTHTAPPSPAAAAEPHRDSGLPLPGLAIGAAALVVLGGALWAVLRRRTR
ncbi:type VII secretion-associated serine protease [Streptomyces capoamus]|uniref:Type VII secretion-associated serine protease n=1 Tax=Streptomyces capoamus TaxID=68183 RepID=A0A919EUS3_9ACTN|nr:S8 family serine peptidase [Streptomyces capoamus]GGW13763.1 type VII secretion-associated serine protease [Streptomyces libani subsp. rufus]GHG40899.1 type VII secretion-associated serine protease [Streptomyces capoamus]